MRKFFDSDSSSDANEAEVGVSLFALKKRHRRARKETTGGKLAILSTLKLAVARLLLSTCCHGGVR